MTLLARLTKAWRVLTAPEMECVLCGCDQWFWRVQGPHPQTICPDCDTAAMESWIAARETGRPLWL